MTVIENIRQDCIDRAKAAHTALFTDVERHLAFDIIEYTAPGLALSVAPGARACLTVQPFEVPSGNLIAGIKIQSPDERTVSYLLLDVIEALKNYALDTTIANLAVAIAHIEKINGYPEIIGWEKSMASR